MIVGSAHRVLRVVVLVHITTFGLVVTTVVPSVVIAVNQPESIRQAIPNVLVIEHHGELDFASELAIGEAHTGADARRFLMQVVQVIVSRVDEADVAAIVGKTYRLARRFAHHRSVHL